MRVLSTVFICVFCWLVAACTEKGGGNGQMTKAIDDRPLTPEIINSEPSLSGPGLSRLEISPDGKYVSLLKGRIDDAGQQDLWLYHLKTGESKPPVSSTDLLAGPEVLSAEEKNRRERAREYGKGIVDYNWDAKGEQLLFSLGGDVYVYNLATGKSRQLTNTEGFETDAKVSPLGQYVSYVRDNELYIAPVATGRERRLSYGATGLVRNATASFVVQEELARNTGYWFSPDDTRIAYTQINESPVAIEERIEFSANAVENIAQRYPFAGTSNATVKLGIVPHTGGDTVWADIGDNPDIYLARVYWRADSKQLYATILSRDHKSLKFLAIDPETGTSAPVFEETSPTWINVRGSFHALEDGGFLWTSERDGFHHIYHYGTNGTNPVQITRGNWPVGNMECVDEAARQIYFTGWRESALERHVFRVDFDGGNLTQLSKRPGWHGAHFAASCTAYIGTHDSISEPPSARVFDNEGNALIWLNENAVTPQHPYGAYSGSHIKPEFGQIAAADGSMMDYVLYRPEDLGPDKKHPAITIVYGGPGVQPVANHWRGALFAQMLVDHGFVVFQMDNRGATNRGKAFEDHLYRAIGQSEVLDQGVGAEFLKSLPYVDAGRMGVYGWSYGGYLALHMLARTDDYKAGVSGAPVTDWSLYDTAYTERYLGDPRPDNVNYTHGAYEKAAVFAHIDGLTEPFLLIHGMADDNVVFRHSVMLMDAMQKQGRHNMRIMTYPGEKHGFRARENRIHRDRQILDFFLQQL